MSRPEKLLVGAVLLLVCAAAAAAELTPIQLDPPDKKGGLPLMEALSVRASAVEWSERDLSRKELSDLLWAANGINRPESKKRTAPSAMNARDIDVYAFLKEGAYLYDPEGHALRPVLGGDFRSAVAPDRRPQPAGAPPPPPPVLLVLVSESARFRMGSPEQRREWGALDAGIVSQNVSLFCAATGLETRPRASMDEEKVRSLLGLGETQHVLLNHPVGHPR